MQCVILDFLFLKNIIVHILGHIGEIKVLAFDLGVVYSVFGLLMECGPGVQEEFVHAGLGESGQAEKQCTNCQNAVFHRVFDNYHKNRLIL